MPDESVPILPRSDRGLAFAWSPLIDVAVLSDRRAASTGDLTLAGSIVSEPSASSHGEAAVHGYLGILRVADEVDDVGVALPSTSSLPSR